MLGIQVQCRGLPSRWVHCQSFKNFQDLQHIVCPSHV